MKLYDPETDSAYLQKWWIDLNLDQAEFENLFTRPLRNLSALGALLQNPAIKFQYEADGRGFWLCAWMEPLLTNGVQVGAWIRKDKRGTKQALWAMDGFYESVLGQASCLIGVTRQYPALHELHLKLGYTYVDVFPGVFDGHDVHVYKMTRESRDARAEVAAALRQTRKQKYEHERREKQDNPVDVEAERPTRIAHAVESGRRFVGSLFNGQAKDGSKNQRELPTTTSD